MRVNVYSGELTHSVSASNPGDICQRRAPDGRLVCGHVRKEHNYAKKGQIYVAAKGYSWNPTAASVEIKNLKGFCSHPLCSCIAFVELDGSEMTNDDDSRQSIAGVVGVDPFSGSPREENPFLVRTKRAGNENPTRYPKERYRKSVKKR